MRGKSKWGALLLAVLTVLTSGVAFGQPQGVLEYAPADPVFPLPLGSTRPEAGGLFFAGGFVFYHQTNPMRDQPIAYRGFISTNNDVAPIGTIVGSSTPALNVQSTSGPASYQPGFKVEGGYKFADGSALTIGYLRLTEAHYSYGATLFPPGLQLGNLFQESFLFSPVAGFPNQFNGPFADVRDNNGNSIDNGAAGIWNAADVMTISFEQRFQDVYATYRMPVWETECYRLSGLMGVRKTWIWERFLWRTTDLNEDGLAGPTDVAIYSNTVSNNLYGAFIGTEQEWYWGHGFAGILDLKATAYMDIVKEDVRYLLSDRSIGSKRGKRDYYFVPEVEASAGIMWFPIEAVQIKIGYDVMAFFNTVSSPRPVDFDFNALNPGYSRTFRFFDGFQAAIALNF